MQRQPAGRTYSKTSQRLKLEPAVHNVGINLAFTHHWLRRKYDTPTLEGAPDLRCIQELSGHRSSRTAENYIHERNEN